VGIPKKKTAINGDLLLKPFQKKKKVCLSTTTQNKHEMNITQNISFLMNFFQKIRKFLEDELHYKFAKFQKVYEKMESLGYIS
jgi:hypothetical protein